MIVISSLWRYYYDRHYDNRNSFIIQATGGQWFTDASPFSILFLSINQISLTVQNSPKLKKLKIETLKKYQINLAISEALSQIWTRWSTQLHRDQRTAKQRGGVRRSQGDKAIKLFKLQHLLNAFLFPWAQTKRQQNNPRKKSKRIKKTVWYFQKLGLLLQTRRWPLHLVRFLWRKKGQSFGSRNDRYDYNPASHDDN